MRTPDLPWSVPLTAQLQNGLQHLFAGPSDALDFLENEWPTRLGEKYEQAVRLCREALDKRAPLEIAREAFIAACLEAGMPIVATPPPHARHSSEGQRSVVGSPRPSADS